MNAKTFLYYFAQQMGDYKRHCISHFLTSSSKQITANLEKMMVFNLGKNCCTIALVCIISTTVKGTCMQSVESNILKIPFSVTAGQSSDCEQSNDDSCPQLRYSEEVMAEMAEMERETFQEREGRKEREEHRERWVSKEKEVREGRKGIREWLVSLDQGDLKDKKERKESREIEVFQAFLGLLDLEWSVDRRM